MKKYSFVYEDSSGRNNLVYFSPLEYLDLMTLLFDQCFEEWGDCKGKAHCGTCHVISNLNLQSSVQNQEEDCLVKLSNRTRQSRLACQIEVSKKLNNCKFIYKGPD